MGHLHHGRRLGNGEVGRPRADAGVCRWLQDAAGGDTRGTARRLRGCCQSNRRTAGNVPRSRRIPAASRGAVEPAGRALVGPACAASPHRRDLAARRARRHHQGSHRRRQDHGLTTVRREPPPDLSPMLATSGTLPISDDGWAYEMKWDGLRALAFVSGGQIRLASRTGRDITFVYPELAGLATAVGVDQAVLDGEIVAFGDSAWPDFEVLQQRMNISTAAQARALSSQIPVSYLAFDLLWLE